VQMKINIITLTILLIIFSFSIKQSLYAQENTGISISPTSLELKIKTEQEYNGSFVLTNNETSSFSLKFKEGTKSEDSFTSSELEWFKVDNSPSILPANSDIIINFSIFVPKETFEGIYTKVLLAELYSGDTTDATIINIAMPFQAYIVVDSLFAGQTGVVIKKFETNKLIFDNNINLKIVVGNADEKNLTKPIGNLNIINPIGSIVYTSVLNESLAALTKDKLYEINTTLPNAGLTDIGQYTVQVLFTDSLSTKSSSAKLTFFSINKLYVIIILVSIIITIMSIRFGKGLIKILKINAQEDSELSIGIKKPNKRKTTK